MSSRHWAQPSPGGALRGLAPGQSTPLLQEGFVENIQLAGICTPLAAKIYSSPTGDLDHRPDGFRLWSSLSKGFAIVKANTLEEGDGMSNCEVFSREWPAGCGNKVLAIAGAVFAAHPFRRHRPGGPPPRQFLRHTFGQGQTSPPRSGGSSCCP